VHKARCIWPSNSTSCVRCRRSNHPCSPPPKRGVPTDDTFVDGASSHAPSSTDLGAESSYLDPPGMANGLGVDPSINERDSNPGMSKAAFIAALSTNTLQPIGQLPLFDGTCARSRCWLPTVDEGYSLLQEFLHDWNSRLPLFEPEGLHLIYRDCYSGVNDDTPLAWVRY
jgi:hypothetical protein